MTANELKPIEGVTAPRATAPYFSARTIDPVRALLERSYRLRYQVYCLERKFLPAGDYPDGLETDEFDRHAIHVGAVDAQGELAGTARVIRPSASGLPIFDHCTIFPHETAEFNAENPRLVEVGRLSVSRSYCRRRTDLTLPAGDARRRGANYRGSERRHQHEDVFLTLLKALYQASKRIGATHWLAATEKPLQRMLAQRGFPFHSIGPDSDYFGLVAPYQMELREFDEVICSGHFPHLDDFLVGLEPQVVRRADMGDDEVLPINAEGQSTAETPMGAV
jgi:N-acyl amino acid synthase of PEP-CTERM/exosortase system